MIGELIRLGCYVFAVVFWGCVLINFLRWAKIMRATVNYDLKAGDTIYEYSGDLAGSHSSQTLKGDRRLELRKAEISRRLVNGKMQPVYYLNKDGELEFLMSRTDVMKKHLTDNFQFLGLIKIWDANAVNESPTAFMAMLVEARQLGAQFSSLVRQKHVKAFLASWPEMKNILLAVQPEKVA